MQEVVFSFSLQFCFPAISKLTTYSDETGIYKHNIEKRKVKIKVSYPTSSFVPQPVSAYHRICVSTHAVKLFKDILGMTSKIRNFIEIKFLKKVKP